MTGIEPSLQAAGTPTSWLGGIPTSALWWIRPQSFLVTRKCLRPA